MSGEQKIAKVERAFIGFEDHGITTVTVSYDYGGSGQSIAPLMFGREGGYDDADDAAGWMLSNAYGMRFIENILKAHGVREWDKLVGRTVMVTATYSDILRIDPLPTECGKPFDIAAFRKQWRDERALA